MTPLVSQYLMAAIDVEKYLQAVSDDSPSGEDLEYDTAFGELERAAQGTPEKVMGDSVEPAVDPQWGDVRDKAVELLERSRDLRIAIHLMCAALHTSGFSALSDGLRLLHGWLDQFWDTVHPGLDEEDDNDPTIRMNCLASLNDRGWPKLIHSLERVPLVESRQLGKFSLRQIRLAKGEAKPGQQEDVPDGGIIDAAFMDCELDGLQETAEAANAAATELEAIDALLRDKVGGEQAPEFDVLKSEIAAIRSNLNTHLQARGVGVEEAGDDAEGGAAQKGEGGLGQIQTREDAIRIIDRLSEYFRKNEPSSPVPLLLQRAKRLVAKDFMEILKDLAPSGVDQARVVSGKDEDD